MCERYRLRYYRGADFDNQPMYEDIDIDEKVYGELFKSFLESKFVQKLETSYEYLVSNYRDYELFYYSTALSHYLELDVDPYRKVTAENNSYRHITNVLTSTYLYVCILQIHKDEGVNSILRCKEKFKKMANLAHAQRYQFTFMSTLRHKINHGGTLNATTNLSPTWSVKLAESNSDSAFLLKKKDKRHLVFDHVVSKSEARRLMKPAHYSNVEASMPNEFYLREATRVYVDILSSMHSQLRNILSDLSDSSDDLFSRHLENPKEYAAVSLVKTINDDTEMVDMENIWLNQKIRKKVKAPLYLQELTLPGENSSVPDDAT